MQTEPDDALARTIVGLAMKIHRKLGPGFVETVYRNALAYELRKTDISFECHPTLTVMYDEIEVGIYLAATKIDNGLLLNFGARSLEFRTKTRSYQSCREAPNLHS